MKNNFKKIFENWENSNKIINKDLNNKNNVKRSKKKSKSLLTIDLHGLTRIDAINKLEKFIYTNQKNKVIEVKIIHGVGRHSNGKRILKDEVLNWLKRNSKIIRNYRPGKVGEGSTGVTIAYINAK